MQSASDHALTAAERQAATDSIASLKARFEQAGELLAAVHLDHALQCLDLDDPLNRERPRRIG